MVDNAKESRVWLWPGNFFVLKKLRRGIWLMYFLYKNEYRIFKTVETTLRRGQR
jgi:hypothetical protein